MEETRGQIHDQERRESSLFKKQLFYFQYRSGISMTKHLNDFNNIIIDLQNLDFEILNEDKTLLLLNSLPNMYDHLITTLL